MKTRRAGRHGSFAARLVLATFASLVSGCLILPIPVPNYDAAGSRGNITKESADQFLAGITTREEVMLMLGEPDYATRDGRQIGYEWTRVKAWLIVSTPAASGAGSMKRSFMLRLTFDEKGRFVRSDLVKEWGDKVSPERLAKTP